jgi:hypothetical protein
VLAASVAGASVRCASEGAIVASRPRAKLCARTISRYALSSASAVARGGSRIVARSPSRGGGSPARAVCRDLAGRVSDLRTIEQPAQILRAPAVAPRDLAGERERAVDGDAEPLVAADAEAVLLVGLRAQRAARVLDEAAHAPAERVDVAGARVAAEFRRAAFVGLVGLALVRALPRPRVGRLVLAHPAQLLHARRHAAGRVRIEVADAVQELGALGVDERLDGDVAADVRLGKIVRAADRGREDLEVVLCVRAQRGRQAHEDVADRAALRPADTGERLVPHRAPAAAVAREAVGVEALREIEPEDVAHGRVVVLAHPAQDLLVGDPRDRGAPVLEQVRPVVLERRVAERVLGLQLRVLQRVRPDAVGVTRPARVRRAGPRVTRRRHRRLRVRRVRRRGLRIGGARGEQQEREASHRGGHDELVSSPGCCTSRNSVPIPDENAGPVISASLGPAITRNALP